MEATLPAAARPSSFFQKVTEQLVDAWRSSCNAFLRWQYDEVIARNPSAEILEDHRETLKWLLWTTRMLHAELLRPGYPARQWLPEVQAKLHQLEDSWDMIHNPLSDAEAEAILQKIFPDEQRVAGAA